MAPGVVQNTETVLPDTLIIGNGNTSIVETIEPKTCPITFSVINQFEKLDKKPVRKVIRPKVLKNVESFEYLYDRLYDEPCPRVVSTELYILLLNKSLEKGCSFLLRTKYKVTIAIMTYKVL